MGGGVDSTTSYVIMLYVLGTENPTLCEDIFTSTTLKDTFSKLGSSPDAMCDFLSTRNETRGLLVPFSGRIYRENSSTFILEGGQTSTHHIMVPFVRYGRLRGHTGASFQDLLGLLKSASANLNGVWN